MNEIKSAKEPTEAQIKELWEGCGLKKPHYFWRSPSGKQLTAGTPPVDLNNLWEYVIPQLCKEYRNWRSVLHDWIDQCTGDYGKDTLALFWAIYEVMKENDR